MQVKSSMQAGMPTLAVDVPPVVFEAMCRSPAWVTDNEVWKSMVAAFPTGQAGYADQVRDAFKEKKGEGWSWVLAFAVKEERMGLVPLT
jgi:hypothetical protein